MNTLPNSRRQGAFTLVELLAVIAIIGILAALLLPVLGRTKLRAKRIWCENNLAQMGVAFHTFANDHNGHFPMMISTNDGGSLEFVAAGYQTHGPIYFSFQHFRPLAGELATPQPLACPADLGRWPATNFNQFNNWNLSYVIGLKAEPGIPGAILAGDRNFPACPLLGYADIKHIPCAFPESWGLNLHERKGNMLFSDGHVEESYDAIVQSEETVAEDLVVPDVEMTNGFSSAGGSGGAGAGNSVPPSINPGANPSFKPAANTPGDGGAGSKPGPGSGTGTLPMTPPAGGQGNRSPNVSSGNNRHGNSAVASGASSNAGARVGAPSFGSQTGFPDNIGSRAGNGANSNTNSQTASQPATPPGTFSARGKKFNKTVAGPPEPESSPATTQNASAEPGAPGGAAIASNNADWMMSPANRHLARFLQHLFFWGYLLLLLLLLLYLAYKLWRRAQQKEKQRQKAMLEKAAQESTLDSDTLLR